MGYKMDGKRIEQLYRLLERAEREKDTAAVSALRWAIFQLENQNHGVADPPDHIPVRGAPRKADLERRQYIRELKKLGHSLKSIADATGMSKTQVHAITKEPDVKGRWYSIDDGIKIYYDSYLDAHKSGHRKIRFESNSF